MTEAESGPEQSDPGEERIADAPPQHTRLWVVLSRWLLATEAWLRSHGGPRLRWGIRGFWALVAAAGLLLLFGPVINAPLSLDDITDSADSATESWIARDFDVSYDVERTDDGHLTARVEERITAFFPEGVDEHGIRRVLATQYQGHALEPTVLGATMDGEPIDIARTESTDQLTLTLDRPDGTTDALQGDHDFMLSYELHDLAYLSTDQASGEPVQLLEWDVFGPDWGQALAGLEVSVTLPEDVDDRLVRQPRGTLAWLIIGGGEWLTAEPGAQPGTVTYSFENDQNIPPHAQARFAMSFDRGTFTLPEPTLLFWVQVYGPLAPLGILALTLLLALAARAVAWSDARGRPWFVAQYERPEGVSPRLAAQILREPAALELAARLGEVEDGARGSGRKRRTGIRPRPLSAARGEQLRRAARAAARTGRLGDRPRALAGYLTAPERRTQLTAGYRRIPRGFVRDLFIAAPIALTLVQWGLVRQLSHQTVLAVVWWPVAFVLVSSAVALVVLTIALTSRPLTRKGALVKQHLRGIGVYAERTRMLARGPSGEALLPYAVLLAPPREAGRRVLNLIIGDLGDADAGRGWRTPSFLTTPRLIIRLLGLVLVAGAIAAVALLPAPYPRSYDYASYWGDIPGTLFTKVRSMDAVAELTRDDDRRARLDVTERLEVEFDDQQSSVPQFAQQWPAERDGQDLGLQVTGVRVDGAEVPFDTSRDADTLLMTTRLVKVIAGAHDLEVDYSLGSAAFAGRGTDGGAVDQVRWAALLEGWDHDSAWGDDPVPDPLTIELRVDSELAGEAIGGGWITQDTTAESPSSWPETVLPFGSIEAGEVYGLDPALEPAPDGSDADSSVPGGVESHELDLVPDEYGGWPFELRLSDTGARLDFPAGTFAGPDPGALQRHDLRQLVPMTAVLGTGGLALVLGAAGLLLRRRRRDLVSEPGTPRDLLRWLAPAAALSSLILFFWMTADMPDDRAEFLPLAAGAVAGLVGGVVALVASRGLKRRP
ncbi:DUF2207 domain-containing protein [Herbiconiux solani]|uniref:DUF2207 domain-containing protein n=1 Tax=Herbiconiux solani TaxID=661329 RepID=UPI000824C91C|nr:DUF2207 domain-containing protein [Herbiconiux solani]